MDVVAVGFSNGTILMVNLLYNQVLLKFKHSAEDGAIRRISFSSDMALGVSLLASISERSGEVVFWDLN